MAPALYTLELFSDLQIQFFLTGILVLYPYHQALSLKMFAWHRWWLPTARGNIKGEGQCGMSRSNVTPGIAIWGYGWGWVDVLSVSSGPDAPEKGSGSTGYIRNPRCEDASAVTKIPLLFRKQKWLVIQKTWCAVDEGKGRKTASVENMPRKRLSELENSSPAEFSRVVATNGTILNRIRGLPAKETNPRVLKDTYTAGVFIANQGVCLGKSIEASEFQVFTSAKWQVCNKTTISSAPEMIYLWFIVYYSKIS